MKARHIIVVLLIGLLIGAFITPMQRVAAQAMQQVVLHVGSAASPVAVSQDDGVLRTIGDHPDRFSCTVTTSTATTLTAVGGSCAAPGAGVSLYITDILFAASAAGIAADAHPTLKYGTGGTCGTGTTVFWQALSAAAVLFQDNRTIPIKIPANNEICWISSTAGSKALIIGGYIAP